MISQIDGVSDSKGPSQVELTQDLIVPILGFLVVLLAPGGHRWRARRTIREEIELLQLLDKDSPVALRLKERTDRRLERYVPPPRDPGTDPDDGLVSLIRVAATFLSAMSLGMALYALNVPGGRAVIVGAIGIAGFFIGQVVRRLVLMHSVARPRDDGDSSQPTVAGPPAGTAVPDDRHGRQT